MADYDTEFELAYLRMIKPDEGGHAIVPGDAGGDTWYGISRRSYPYIPWPPTPDEAKTIYYRDWWRKYAFALLPGPIACKLLDLAINIGAVSAHTMLRTACVMAGTMTSEEAASITGGVVSRVTAEAAHAAEPGRLMRSLIAAAENHYRAIVKARPEDAKFLAGWLKRADELPPVGA